MKTIRQINIENRQDYFFSFDELIMYDIKYIQNLNSFNFLYLVFNKLDAYIEKSGENRYLIFVSTEKIK